MLNRKLDILSNEINDYFVINNTTKNSKENIDDEIFDKNLVIDTVSYEKYKYLQNQIFDLKNILIKISNLFSFAYEFIHIHTIYTLI